MNDSNPPKPEPTVPAVSSVTPGAANEHKAQCGASQKKRCDNWFCKRFLAIYKFVEEFPSPNNPYERWTIRLQIVGLVGLGLVYWQIRESAEELQATKYATANSWILDLDKSFLDHSKLRPYFYDNASIPSTNDVEYKKVMAMSEYTLDTFDSFVTHRFPGKEPVPPSWSNWMVYTFSNSPSLVSYMTNHIDWYNSQCTLYDKVFSNWYAGYLIEQSTNSVPGGNKK